MENYDQKIILSAAMSIDGKIATKKGDSKLSSKKDLIRLHKIRSKVDAIIVGSNTVKRDNPLLTVRYTKGKNPIRIILDSKGKISQESKILKTSDKVKTIIVISKMTSKKNLEKLNKFPIEIVFAGKNKINLKLLLKNLKKRKIKKILLEGGGTLNWEFIKHNLVDEFLITVTPHLIGGKDSVSLVQGSGFDKIAKSPKIRISGVKRLENDLVLHYTKL